MMMKLDDMNFGDTCDLSELINSHPQEAFIFACASFDTAEFIFTTLQEKGFLTASENSRMNRKDTKQ